MAHSIHVGFLSVNETIAQIVTAVIQNQIISEKNIYIAEDRLEQTPGYKSCDINVLSDDPSVLMKSEIAVIAAPKRDVGTVLATVCALTRGKILIVISQQEVDCAYVQERVARGTLVVSVSISHAQDGTRLCDIAYSDGFPEYMKDVCEEIIAVTA